MGDAGAWHGRCSVRHLLVDTGYPLHVLQPLCSLSLGLGLSAYELRQPHDPWVRGYKAAQMLAVAACTSTFACSSWGIRSAPATYMAPGVGAGLRWWGGEARAVCDRVGLLPLQSLGQRTTLCTGPPDLSCYNNPKL